MKKYKPYLMHIIEECEYLERNSQNLKFEDFLSEYFGVDYEIVWDVVLNKIPELKGKIRKILEEM